MMRTFFLIDSIFPHDANGVNSNSVPTHDAEQPSLPSDDTPVDGKPGCSAIIM